MINNNYSEIIIIGSGLAGLYTALSIDDKFNITIISKENIEENNSSLAQGGIAASIKDDDDPKLHMEDTLRAGSRINNIESLRCLVEDAKNGIENLIKFGVKFDKDNDGKLKTTMEGGHSKRRILHARGDATGKEIIESLIVEIRKRDNIVILDNTMAIDLLTLSDRCIGVKVLRNGKITNILGVATILATGGIGEVYNSSTNSRVATGDGISMAYRAGCKISNMEFVQFHPTAFYSNKPGQKFLISEAVRGEGGILRNKYGKRFMNRYHKSLDLAPRDVVSQSIYKELERTGSNYVYLDITHREKEYLIDRFPTIYKRCLEEGIDISKDYIPVVPVEHYLVGGIDVDLNGKTSLKGLYACGECSSTGVHGGNRLASNSLLECIVFGKRISDNIKENKYKPLLKDTSISRNRYLKEINYTEGYKITIKETMEKYVGIVKWKEGLIKAEKIIEDIIDDMKNKVCYEKTYMEVLNMAVVSKLIIRDSILREESIGCHYRIDDKGKGVI